MSDSQKPHHAFVLMGVSGCGKSAVATGLNAAFLDGDYLHPRAYIEKMAAGHPLNDADREPWLKAINDAIFAMQRTNELSVIVCSALKKSYRDILRRQNKNLSLIWLKGDFELIESRLKARKGHFFKPEMAGIPSSFAIFLKSTRVLFSKSLMLHSCSYCGILITVPGA